MNVLKQSTAVTIKLGPFVDATDGVTAETALTIAQADVRLTKNGGDIAQKTEATSATHDELGYYDVPLDTTDTNTVGTLRVMVSESGALPVFRDFQVVEEAVYDALFGSGAAGPLLATADGSTLTTLATASALATVDGIVDDILVDTGTTLPGTLSTLATASALGTVDGNVTAILEDTGTTIPATLSGLATASALATVDGIVDDILVDTGTTLPATLATVLKADTAYTVTTTNGSIATTYAS